MKTKFILHGGNLKLADKRNDTYFQEVTKGLTNGDEVLFIGFAQQEEDNREEYYQRDKRLILAQTKADLTVVNATYDNLMAQLTRAKAIHVTGGETAALINDMRQYPDFIAALKGKTVGGSSAGAYLFSSYYFNHEQGMVKGLETLPIRIKAHYGNPDLSEGSLTELKETSPELELLLLEECSWVVREVDL